MTEDMQVKLIAALEKSSDAVCADVLQFVEMRLAQRKADMTPITVEKWERLKPWQRKVIYWRVRWFSYLNTLHKRKSA